MILRAARKAPGAVPPGASGRARLGDRLAVLGLVPADLLAGQAELPRDVNLLGALLAGAGDRTAEGKPRVGDRLAGREVSVSRVGDLRRPN